MISYDRFLLKKRLLKGFIVVNLWFSQLNACCSKPIWWYLSYVFLCLYVFFREWICRVNKCWKYATLTIEIGSRQPHYDEVPYKKVPYQKDIFDAQRISIEEDMKFWEFTLINYYILCWQWSWNRLIPYKSRKKPCHEIIKKSRSE